MHVIYFLLVCRTCSCIFLFLPFGQASGPQVQQAAGALGATFNTQVTTLPSGQVDYGCEITDTNRAYDMEAEDVLGPGYFIMELAITQMVLVDSPTPLSDDDVWSIVETGFNRGAGGRVRFRSLLQDKFEFLTVLNVEVLSGTLSPPQAAPSAAPSTSPLAAPSASPSSSPSGSPSASPTAAPSVSPTLSPIYSPSIAPSIAPTTLTTSNPMPVLVPTDGTTSSPTGEGSTVPLTANDEGRQPLILGAIAGGLATILVSLFFIFCVWFPFCKDRDEESTNPEPGVVDSSSSSVSDQIAATMIPGVVNVSDESASLADSTLGDQASILRPLTKKPRVGDTSPSTHQSSVANQDSFDESSLFTSTTEPEKSQNMVITKLLPDSLTNTLDFEDDIIFPLSGSGSDSEGENEAAKSAPTTPRAKSSIDMSESTRRISNVGGYFDDTDDSSFLCSSPVQSDEEKAMAISRIIDRNTKGFDPFADEDSSSSSSFAFDKVEPVESAYYGHPSDNHDDRSSPSNTTASTKDVERLLLGSMRTAETHTARDLVVQDHLSDSRSKSPEGTPDSKEAQGSPRNSRRFESEDRKANNRLLRSVLEDARSLAEKRQIAARSRVSRQSAPPRITKNQESQRVSSPDILADHLDFTLESKRDGSRKSSMSVGAPPLPRLSLKDDGDSAASLPRRSPRKTSSAGDSTRSSGSVSSLQDHHRPFRSRYLEGAAKPKLHNLIPPSGVAVETQKNKSSYGSDSSDSEEDALAKAAGGTKPVPVSPSSVSSSAPPSPSGYLGAEPRTDDRLWKIATEDSVMHSNSEDTSLLDTPASSPGVLGIADKRAGRMLKDDSSTESDGLSNPWLFDVVEQTLGPRSVAADMESISGRSSRSGRSQKSGRSSRRSRSRRRGEPRDASSTRSRSRASRDARTADSQMSSSRRSLGDPSLATRESSELALESENLENDLKRLQLQLADVLQTEMDGVPGENLSVSTSGEEQKLPVQPPKKKKIVVIVPPGKLGIVLANRHDGKGTIVAEIRPNSTMQGMVSPGDKIIGVDEKDVTHMLVNEITTLMASRASSERRLTFVSTLYTAD